MSKTILVVENNRMIRTMYTAGLAGYGFHVVDAASVAAVTALLQGDVCPSVLLVDLSLPDGTGVEVIEMVKQKMGREGLHIVVATSTPVHELNTQALDADLYLQKPLGVEQLLSALQPTA